MLFMGGWPFWVRVAVGVAVFLAADALTWSEMRDHTDDTDKRVNHTPTNMHDPSGLGEDGQGVFRKVSELLDETNIYLATTLAVSDSVGLDS